MKLFFRYLFVISLPGLVFVSCHRSAAPTVSAPQPAAKPQSLVVLLPDSQGKVGGVSVTNSAGTQTLTEAFQAVRIQGAAVAPGTPFAMDQQEVRNVFGALIDALPLPEVSILLYFGLNSDMLTPQSQADLPRIFAAVKERHSTAISVIGHTDTTGNPESNYQLGLRRAQVMADILRAQGADASDVTIESHGDADLLVKTARGVEEPRNRRVEVVIR